GMGDELLANPEQVVFDLRIQRSGWPDAGVYAQKAPEIGAALQPEQELAVCSREVFRDRGRRQVRQFVAAERGAAAVPQERLAVTAGPAEKRQQHVLVVAFQEDAARSLTAQADQPVDDVARGRPAVDIVAEKADRVAGLRRQRIEQSVHLVD